ncbi:hypothetical protein POPTR_004G103300v4 [Populus trichocarpa]|uniref:Uncharacterized protein n=1 Tax=Populus trichocarpa TaxID=3694 RepID=A0ACC0T404_POPTR|nr:phenolic glucoside malonyltransferase 1 [Populus trichocarpa]KAI9396266.1 hypothetical protein POPTR_004G103300v4 [Populus trichocarpa]
MEVENQVNTIDVCQVTPYFDSSESATELSLPLTFHDIMWLKFPPVERIFFYKHTESTPTFFNSVILPKLKHSLSHTLLHFLPLAGNLIWPPQAIKPIILYTPDDGVQLTVAESSADFHLLSGNEVHEAADSRPYIPELPVTDSKASVIALKITLFPNNGFCIGISAHHSVLDGKSSIMFIKAWAHFCKLGDEDKRQYPALLTELTPVFDRIGIQDPEGLGMVYLNNWLELKWPGVDLNPRSLQLLPAIVVRSSSVRATFELSREDIKKLRERVLANLVKEGSNETHPVHLSTFVLVLAHGFGCILKAIGVQSNRKVIMRFAADCRARLDPPMHENYFGNCVSSCAAFTEAESLLEENGFMYVAEMLSELVKTLEKGVLDGAKEKMARNMKEAAGGAALLSVAGSHQFEVYGTDFGWGKPEKVEITSIDRTGAISLAESKDGNGGVEIGLVLEKHEMEKFTSLFVDGLKNHY